MSQKPEMKPELKETLEEFRVHVYENSKSIDPDDERDWSDLAFGWALGQGHGPAMANDVAYHWVSWCHNYAV